MSSIERPLPPVNADERATLPGWLDFHRATLAMNLLRERIDGTTGV